jgi:hypothetical protein
LGGIIAGPQRHIINGVADRMGELVGPPYHLRGAARRPINLAKGGLGQPHPVILPSGLPTVNQAAPYGWRELNRVCAGFCICDSRVNAMKTRFFYLIQF